MHSDKPICLIDSQIVLPPLLMEQVSGLFEIKSFSADVLDFDLLNRSEAFLLHSRLSNEQLNELKNCKYIGIRAHNLDYLDVGAARKMGITIRGIPPVGQVSVAEHTFAMIFALSKQLITLHGNTLSGRWRNRISPNFELYQKYLGVIGYGAVGKRVAELGRGIGMKVIIYDSEKKTETSMPLKEVLSLSDVVTLHIPYNPENHNFMNAERIRMMKKGALLINTARGGILDYKALEMALVDGWIAGAGLDVFEKEPPPITDTFFKLPNIICTPHVAFYSEETLFEMNSNLVQNLIGFFSMPKK